VLAIFDLNGTLTDPAVMGGPWEAPELGERVLARAVQSAMVDAVLGDYRAFSEHIECALRLEIDRRSLEPARLDEALRIAHSLPPFDDVPLGLGKLAAADVRLVVLTNSGQSSGQATLDAASIRDYFERVLGVDAVRSFKPDPAVYRYALEELRCDPQEVTFVTAHGWDLAGAARVGMRTAYLARAEPVSPIFPAPDIVVADVLELAGALLAP
jgi:2-haloacid dehalogenase